VRDAGVNRLHFLLVLCCLFAKLCFAQQVRIPTVPLRDARDLDTLIESIGNARIVLLGEGSHGTSEYYQWRTLISQKLIREKGFRCIAVEGEWADCFRANEFIKGPLKDSAAVVALMQQFNRWPAWMWANKEAVQLVRWLNAENQNRKGEQKIGFYGLDLYCVWESIAALTQQTDGSDTAICHAVEAAYKCFLPFESAAMNYAAATRHGNKGCGAEAGHVWNLLRSRYANQKQTEVQFAQEQYALVVEDGERYFRNIYANAPSWNLRQNHMFTTVQRLLRFYGPDSKIIIWTHNTHAGDARASTMSLRHKLSLGQLLRQAYGDNNVFIVGMGSYMGTVLCGKTWGDTMRKVLLPAARGGSWEDILHTNHAGNCLVLTNALRSTAGLNGYFATRAVGAIYQPAGDSYSVYTNSIMSRRYDAFIYFDTTQALHPLPIKTAVKQTALTYPTGF
jgi:erythromycin esterase-like protein